MKYCHHAERQEMYAKIEDIGRESKFKCVAKEPNLQV